jgi:hypothetical protein
MTSAGAAVVVVVVVIGERDCGELDIARARRTAAQAVHDLHLS